MTLRTQRLICTVSPLRTDLTTASSESAGLPVVVLCTYAKCDRSSKLSMTRYRRLSSASTAMLRAVAPRTHPPQCRLQRAFARPSAIRGASHQRARLLCGCTACAGLQGCSHSAGPPGLQGILPSGSILTMRVLIQTWVQLG